MPCAPVLDEFLKKDNWGRPMKVRVKNTARVWITDHSQESTLRVDPRITDECSSLTGEQSGPPDRDKTINPEVKGGSQFLPLARTRRLEKLDGYCKKEEIAVHCKFFLLILFF